jgi:hypothetical protein
MTLPGAVTIRAFISACTLGVLSRKPSTGAVCAESERLKIIRNERSASSEKRGGRTDGEIFLIAQDLPREKFTTPRGVEWCINSSCTFELERRHDL